jgi:hypothetical protein
MACIWTEMDTLKLPLIGRGLRSKSEKDYRESMRKLDDKSRHFATFGRAAHFGPDYMTMKPHAPDGSTSVALVIGSRDLGLILLANAWQTSKAKSS